MYKVFFIIYVRLLSFSENYFFVSVYIYIYKPDIKQILSTGFVCVQFQAEATYTIAISRLFSSFLFLWATDRKLASRFGVLRALFFVIYPYLYPIEG